MTANTAALGAAARPRAPIVALAIAAVALGGMAALVIALQPRAAVEPAQAVTTPALSAEQVLQDLERRAYAQDGGRMDVQAILATPAYFRITGQPALAERFGAERNVVMIVAQDIHEGDMPERPRPTLIVDGTSYIPATIEDLVESDHHRVLVFVYADASRDLAASPVSLLELRLEGVEERLEWQAPFGKPAGVVAGGLSMPLFLALLGGMLASMWPCLLQLTAYFLPSVAGLSIEEARTGRADRAVLRTAVLFVSGIVVVYTLAGLAAGLAAQSLGGTELFVNSRQPLTFVAGLVIIGMAVRLALRARRPLVCHMPTSAPSRRSGLGTVVLGLAFATGCMTCFGAAVVLGMFTYVVTTASPLVGAAILFVFSLGIAVPLVIAAVAMARVLPLIARLERAAPALSFVSAGIMAAYGALLITGTSHVISDAIARLARVIG